MKKFVLKRRCQTLEELQLAVNQFVRWKLTLEPCHNYISNSELFFDKYFLIFKLEKKLNKKRL